MEAHEMERKMAQENALDNLRLLKAFWTQWKRAAHVIGNFQARLLLTIFYFMVFGPFALVIRVWADPLNIKADGVRGWQKRTNEEKDRMAMASRQF